MKNYRRLRITAYTFTLMGLAVSAHASIAGSAWLVPDGTGSNCAQNAVIACVPTGAGTANATFTLADNGLTTGFNTNGTNGTINQYILSNATVSGLAFANGATTATLLNVPTGAHTNFGACASGQACGTIFEFTGTAFFTHNQLFTVNSDDGVTLYVGGTGAGNIVLSSPGPQSLSTTNGQYTGATGTFAFTFVYSECCSLPAVFNTNLSVGGNVPEPTSIILLGTAMIGMAGLVRRKRRA